MKQVDQTAFTITVFILAAHLLDQQQITPMHTEAQVLARVI